MTLWCQQIKLDLYQLGLANYWNNPVEILLLDSHSEWKELVKKAVCERDVARWVRHVSARPILRTYRQLSSFSTDSTIAAYLTIPHGGWNDRVLLGRQGLTRLRCGVNELRIHTGRYDGLDEEFRICLICANGVEDERHFLLDCDEYESSRVALWSDLEQLMRRTLTRDRLTQLERTAGYPFQRASIPASVQFMILGDGEHVWFDRECELYRRSMHRILIAVSDWFTQRKRIVELHQQWAARVDAE